MILIDTDAGIDDTAAILLALLKKEEIDNKKVGAITVVAGNTSLENGIKNIKTLVALCQAKKVSIFAGCGSPLIQGQGGRIVEETRWTGHGKDGLGGFTECSEFLEFEKEFLSDSNTVDSVKVEEMHAAVAIVELAKKGESSGDRLDILALGPLTNLATAITLDPSLLSRLGSVTIMGGTLNGKGNASHCAEFNFHYDPYAAHIVFHSSSIHSANRKVPIIQLVTWETCLEHGLSWSFWEQGKESKPFGYLLNTICNEYKRQSKGSTSQSMATMNEYDRHKHYLGQVSLCDVYASFALLYPETVVKVKDWDLKIELDGQYTRGANLFDWMGLSSGATTGNCSVVFQFDIELVKSRLLEIFQTAPLDS